MRLCRAHEAQVPLHSDLDIVLQRDGQTKRQSTESGRPARDANPRFCWRLRRGEACTDAKPARAIAVVRSILLLLAGPGKNKKRRRKVATEVRAPAKGRWRCGEGRPMYREGWNG